MANPLSYPVLEAPVPVTVNEAHFALSRVLLPEPDDLPPTEAHKQTASSGKAKPLSDSHSSFLAGSLLICGCKPQMLCRYGKAVNLRSATSIRGIVAALSTQMLYSLGYKP